MKKSDLNKRSISGKIASVIGIIVNVLLAGAKIFVGSLFGLISVVADGINNLTDCGSSILSFVSFKLSSKPADKEHPYGHERIEYICSLSVAFLVLLVAFETISESVNKLINPTEVAFSVWVIIVLAVSIVAKFGLFVYYKTTAKRINSDVLMAAATDSISDCISTFVAIATIIIGVLTGFNADGIGGVLVALFISWQGVGLLRGIFSNLIGKAPDKDMIKCVKDRIMSHEGVLSVHDLSIYSYGPNKFFASAHIEVPSNVDVLISHELIDEIERDFIENTNIVLTGHLDPIEIDNPLVNQLREKVEKIVFNMNQSFSIHDFRIVKGERRTNVLFDVAIPYDAEMTKEQIKDQIEKAIKEIDRSYCLIVTIEYCI